MNLFCFDFSGSGKSEGNYCTLGFYEKEDLECVIEYLVNIQKVGKIGIWGRSMGGVTALLYSDKDPRINCLIIDSAFLSFKKLVKEVMKTKAPLPGFLMSGLFSILKSTVNSKAKFDLDALCPIKHCNKINIPALYGAGLDDTFVLPQHTKELYQTHLGPKEMFLFEGDHNSRRPLKFILAISDFLKQNLVESIEKLNTSIANSVTNKTQNHKTSPKNIYCQQTPPNLKFSITEQKDNNGINMTRFVNEIILSAKKPPKSLKKFNNPENFETQKFSLPIKTEHCISTPNIHIPKHNRERQFNSMSFNHNELNKSRYIQSPSTSNNKLNAIFPIANLLPYSSFLKMHINNEIKNNDDSDHNDDNDGNGTCNQLADVISCENLVNIPNKMHAPRIVAKQMKSQTQDSSIMKNNYGSTNSSQISTGISTIETPKIYNDLNNRILFDEIKDNIINELSKDTTRDFKEGEHKLPKPTYCPFTKENKPFDRSKKEPQLNQQKENNNNKSLRYLLDSSLLTTKELQLNTLNSATEKKFISKNSTQIIPISNKKNSLNENKSQSFVENNNYKTNHRIIFDNISQQHDIKKVLPNHWKSNSFTTDSNRKIFNIKYENIQDQKQLIRSITGFKKNEKDSKLEQKNNDKEPIKEEDYSTNSKSSSIEIPNTLYTHSNITTNNTSIVKNTLNKSRFHIFDEKIINKYSN